MARFVVRWEIDIEAESPEAAAREAWSIMRRTGSTANTFDVDSENGDSQRIDLQGIDESAMSAAFDMMQGQVNEIADIFKDMQKPS